jgi:hypothetical protein
VTCLASKVSHWQALEWQGNNSLPFLRPGFVPVWTNTKGFNGSQMEPPVMDQLEMGRETAVLSLVLSL